MKEKGLSGYYFVTHGNEDKKLLYQGQIMENKVEGYVLCDLFSWLDGSYTNSVLVPSNLLDRLVLFNNKERFEEFICKRKEEEKHKSEEKE